MRRIGTLVVAFLLVSHGVARGGLDLSGTLWEAAAQKYSVDAHLLYSIAVIESRQKVNEFSLAPNPLAINIEGTPYYPKSTGEARKIINAALRSNQSIGIGLMQITMPFHAHRIDHPADLLDIKTNVYVGAEILQEALASTRDIKTGIGRYHSWTPELATPYARQVLLVYEFITGGRSSDSPWE